MRKSYQVPFYWLTLMSPVTSLENYATCQLIEKGTPANSRFRKYAVLSLHWVTEHITCYLIG